MSFPEVPMSFQACQLWDGLRSACTRQWALIIAHMYLPTVCTPHITSLEAFHKRKKVAFTIGVENQEAPELQTTWCKEKLVQLLQNSEVGQGQGQSTVVMDCWTKQNFQPTRDDGVTHNSDVYEVLRIQIYSNTAHGTCFSKLYLTLARKISTGIPGSYTLVLK